MLWSVIRLMKCSECECFSASDECMCLRSFRKTEKKNCTSPGRRIAAAHLPESRCPTRGSASEHGPLAPASRAQAPAPRPLPPHRLVRGSSGRGVPGDAALRFLFPRRRCIRLIRGPRGDCTRPRRRPRGEVESRGVPVPYVRHAAWSSASADCSAVSKLPRRCRLRFPGRRGSDLRRRTARRGTHTAPATKPWASWLPLAPGGGCSCAKSKS